MVEDIVEQILSQAAARYEGAETLLERDVPLVPVLVEAVCLAVCLIIVWRLEL